MTQRARDIEVFLTKAGWGDAEREPVPGDASSRRYERLSRAAERAVLMDAPKVSETPSEPEGASVEDRRKLGYNALARLAGPDQESFAAIAKELTQRGFSAPHILAADFDKGLLLLEDLGDDLFAGIIAKDPDKEQPLYEAAIDTLAAIYRSSFPQNFDEYGTPWTVRNYDRAALKAEADLFLQWFVPDLGVQLSKQALDEWKDIWTELFGYLEAHAPGLALRDFHAENLFWLPERHETARVGLIDFQDGLFAHPAYDLVSLLEDARRDVSPQLIQPLKSRFCEKAGIAQDASFENAYAVMAAQRNAKILGIFVRLAKRDKKTQYRDLIPRVAALFASDLKAQSTKPLEAWVEAYLPGVFKEAPQIKTAMVMAAGHGTRMRPLTNNRSKAMVEVGGKPLIDHMLDRLKDAGIERAVVNVHAHADHLEAHLKNRKGLPEIIISDERQVLLETGGGVVKALPLLGDDPILVCNIDAIWLENAPVIEGLMARWQPDKMDDLLLLVCPKDSLGYDGPGDLDLDGSQRISWREGDRADYVYAGVQICSLDLIKTFKLEPFTRKNVWKLSIPAGRAYGHVLDGFWMHVGDPKARIAAEAKLNDG